MAFTKDDREYIKDTVDTAIVPVKESIVRLQDQFDDHDDETKEINNKQQQMMGAWATVKYMILPVVFLVIGGIVTWFLMK